MDDKSQSVTKDNIQFYITKINFQPINSKYITKKL
jgi:hypothetical protein